MWESKQGGIEESVPKAISKEKMGQLLMFLDDDSKQEVLDAYEEDETTYDKEAYGSEGVSSEE